MTRTTGRQAALAELCDRLFASLPRSDQRRTGRDYIRGLLDTEGRKSFRNMAASLGGDANLEQRLHHFASCSTWDWRPMRRALARHMTATAVPDAWVVRPLVIPKEGDNTVGVHQRYVPTLGQVLNAQYAVGLWAASRGRCYPVGWRLLLTHDWLDDPARRAQGGIPDDRTAESYVDAAIEAYLDLVAGMTGPSVRRPLVLAADTDAVRAIHRLRAAGAPFVVRADPGLPLHAAGPAPAPVRVRSPFHPAGPSDDLLLIDADQTWLTNQLDTDPAALHALTTLPTTVDDSCARITDHVGLRDFTGRTYAGWNRHTTLVSAAHCLTLLA
ncbi:transposase [Kitasatospora sp. NPDC093558]|uniref:IS701 family transposase n=1 Tax=Kitasatospora sp. NPDC093558 TaxID=3155201 RepID=UPI0034266B6D